MRLGMGLGTGRSRAILNPVVVPPAEGPPARDFDPRTVGGLALWLRADYGLYQMSDGTVPVASAGDPVGRWMDVSGNGRDLIQDTTAAKPLYTPSVAALGGMPAIYRGVGAYLSHLLGSSVTGPGTIFAVLQTDTPIQAANAIILSTSAGSPGYTRLDKSGDFWRATIRDDANQLKMTSILQDASTAPQVLVARVDSGLDTWHGITAGASRTGITRMYHSEYVIGAKGTGDPYQGNLAEVLIFQAALSDADRIAVTNSLMSVYGITA